MPIPLFAAVSAVLYLISAWLFTRRPRAIAFIAASVAVLTHAAILVGQHGGGVDLHFFAALSLV
ncbi:MAG: inner membrane protein YpjD, partial [Deltaproteobacteria bacterium]